MMSAVFKHGTQCREISPNPALTRLEHSEWQAQRNPTIGTAESLLDARINMAGQPSGAGNEPMTSNRRPIHPATIGQHFCDPSASIAESMLGRPLQSNNAGEVDELVIGISARSLQT
jgi:hypothetical protein